MHFPHLHKSLPCQARKEIDLLEHEQEKKHSAHCKDMTLNGHFGIHQEKTSLIPSQRAFLSINAWSLCPTSFALITGVLAPWHQFHEHFQCPNGNHTLALP